MYIIKIATVISQFQENLHFNPEDSFLALLHIYAGPWIAEISVSVSHIQGSHFKYRGLSISEQSY